MREFIAKLHTKYIQANLLMLKEGRDWIRHYLIIPFTVAGYMHGWHKWHTYTDMLNPRDIPITLLLPSNSAIHSTHLEASPSSGLVGSMSNPSMYCSHWDQIGGGEWTAWHLVPVLGHSQNPLMTVSQLSCSVLVIWTSCPEGPCSNSAVSKEVKYTWAYKLFRIGNLWEQVGGESRGGVADIRSYGKQPLCRECIGLVNYMTKETKVFQATYEEMEWLGTVQLKKESW